VTARLQPQAHGQCTLSCSQPHAARGPDLSPLHENIAWAMLSSLPQVARMSRRAASAPVHGTALPNESRRVIPVSASARPPMMAVGRVAVLRVGLIAPATRRARWEGEGSERREVAMRHHSHGVGEYEKGWGHRRWLARPAQCSPKIRSLQAWWAEYCCGSNLARPV